jgi:hypothetical protein
MELISDIGFFGCFASMIGSEGKTLPCFEDFFNNQLKNQGQLKIN